MAGETPVRSDDHLLTPDNSALVIIDYQPEQVDTVGSIGRDEMMLNVEALARAANSYELPVVLSTVGVKMGANSGTITELREALPSTGEIDRSTLNSWEDPDFRAAVEATGRKKIIMTGLWTEVCVAFPSLDMVREGYEIYPVIDAIGGISPAAHEAAMQRMVQAGPGPSTPSPWWPSSSATGGGLARAACAAFCSGISRSSRGSAAPTERAWRAGGCTAVRPCPGGRPVR